MRTVLVNGGSRGIGAEVVRLFAARGDRVAFTYRSAEEAALSLSAQTGALAIRADSACEGEVKAAVARVACDLGPVDVLVNSAAISSFSLFTDLTAEAWERIFAVNVHGPFYYSRAVLPAMIARHRGSIINISSMWGVTGASCEVHYSTTKAALNGMTRALAREVGPSGITVNAVAPGVIDTEMNGSLTEQTKRDLCEETPLCRLGTPREVAEAVYFLASDAASFITGQVIGVNGGFVTQ